MFLVFQVEYYGSPVSLKSIAQISTPDGTSLLLQPYDKSRYMSASFSLFSLVTFMIQIIPKCFHSLKAIEKAIVSSDLGVTPNNDGDVIRLSLPPLTSERRKVSLPLKSISSLFFQDKEGTIFVCFLCCSLLMCVFNLYHCRN